MRNIIAILMIAASIGIFFGYIKPTYSSITAGDGIKEQISQYDDTLQQADVITTKLAQDKEEAASLNADAVNRLNKLLPQNVDNVHLIIDMSNIASNYGLAISNIGLAKADTTGGVPTEVSNTPYDSIDFSFSVTTTYDNFLTFLQALERSLRLVDVTAISFTPTDKGDTYNFNITIRTYWLK